MAAGIWRPFLLASELAPAIGAESQLVFVDFAAERIAMDSEDLCGAGSIAVGALEGALDEFFLELGDCFCKQDAAFDHLPDEIFELFFHGHTLHCDASTYSLRGLVINPKRGR